MPRTRLVGALLVGVTTMAVGGCGILGEQQFWFFAQNDTEQPLIVRLDHWPDVLVDPGVNGRVGTSFGAIQGPILILDRECTIVYSIEVTTQTGSIWLRRDGTVRLAEVEVDRGRVQLPLTDACDAAG